MPLEAYAFEEESLGSHDVEVAIAFCGICHSDVHLIDNDWGISGYPLVPGHEIIGTVTTKGDEVPFDIGQRVGIGWQRSACLTCNTCVGGHENICASSEATCVGHPGGFADKIRADGRFCFAIPENLPSETAAPLLCGGATVFSPLHRHRVQGRIGIVGVGGLGHLAIQYASAMGCEVYAISHSPSKEAEAKSLGADHFLTIGDLDQAPPLDFVLSTVSADIDWEAIINLVGPNGTLCNVGVPGGPIAISPISLIMQQRSICGSAIGSRLHIREMLAFSAGHGIVAKTEVFPLEKVNEALERVRKNEARYRVVLQM